MSSTAQAIHEGNIMNKYLVESIEHGRAGHLYASVYNQGRVSLVCLGSYEAVRHRYNQLACLIAGTAMQTLLACKATGHTRSAPLGSWFDRLTDGNPAVGTPNTLFELASLGPDDRADCVGYLAFHADWPVGTTTAVSGTASMAKSLGEIGRVVFDFVNYPMVRLGSAAEVSAVKRAQEGIKASKRAGHTPYQEEHLLNFMETLRTARGLHFLHEVSLPA
jgi:hypothetical protein